MTAREPINLTALRAHLSPSLGGRSRRIDVDVMLALIDAVEAARRVHSVLSETPVVGRDRRLAGYLAPVLERFTP